MNARTAIGQASAGAATGIEDVRGWPVSRILSQGLPPLDDHSSAAAVTGGVKLPTRASGLRCPCGRPFRARPRMRPLFGIAPGGACRAVPVTRTAVGSYPTVSPLLRKRSGLFSVALSLGLPPPGITRHPCLMESGLSSKVSPRGHPAIRTDCGLRPGRAPVNRQGPIPHMGGGPPRPFACTHRKRPGRSLCRANSRAFFVRRRHPWARALKSASDQPSFSLPSASVVLSTVSSTSVFGPYVPSSRSMFSR